MPRMEGNRLPGFSPGNTRAESTVKIEAADPGMGCYVARRFLDWVRVEIGGLIYA